MTAAEAFLFLDREGLTVCIEQGRLVVWPATLARPDLCALARQHHAELLALARDAEERAALVVETARRKAREVQRLRPEARP
ncbi:MULTISPECIES: hypothetical protein [unclassified Variovorax]|uniref:hypothetical protein n=1 Tax=unclassified Variovorax TaxID=663243 RepID=UPI000839422A|nr:MULTISPECIES: hypothetical protein [unclassified Variovorax]PNG46385.1 hypothetical protein CHC06_06726 [Variovorax sp. B2]PNG47793.1 hypothetical protein CHC07_06961 [Variovorax sp. B4]VTV14120.1 hypothetical protein WDL1CHR_04699 [Variovorax sp. WDL1]